MLFRSVAALAVADAVLRVGSDGSLTLAGADLDRAAWGQLAS